MPENTHQADGIREHSLERREPVVRSAGPGNRTSRPTRIPWLTSTWGQYALAFTTFVVVSLLNFLLQRWIGYEAIAMVYLLVVVLLALYVGRGPTLLGTGLTALGWNFLFAPPRYSFHIAGFYDKMMLATYFIVALTVGQVVQYRQRLREAEVHARLLSESERLGRTL